MTTGREDQRVTVRDVTAFLETRFPKKLACEWDNVGLLVGDDRETLHTVFIALDATDSAVEEAAEAGAELFVAHHPLIFHGLHQVTAEDYIGGRVMRLIQKGMACYAAHTNFDVTVMADLASEKLGLHDCAVLQPAGTWSENGEPEKIVGIGKIGMLSGEMRLSDCAADVKKQFDLTSVRVFGNPDRSVHHAAICPGSGKSVIEDAIRLGAQVLITGDIDHHAGIDAAARGLSVIDAGHYGLEKIFLPYMQDTIGKAFPELTVVRRKEQSPFVDL